MSAVTEELVLGALSTVKDPDLNRDIVTLKFVKDLVIEGSTVRFTVELTTPACPVKEELQNECYTKVKALPGVDEVEVTMTARVPQRRSEFDELLPGVRQIVAVASGKGGVGKSTVTVNLAVALAQQGARVGLLDADVYGPSIPMMMGTEEERPLTKDNKIIPISRFGVSMMSMGHLLEEGQAVLWRGPMVAGTVKQLLQDVAWGELDYLLVDLPPGTGDAPMTLAQTVPLSGVLIVTTPHSVAANIAGKAAALFRRLNSPILGVVENMAEFVCPKCGEVSRIFSGLKGDELAMQLQVPFLGSIPLDPEVGEASDKGMPSVVYAPQRPQAQAFREVAGQLAAQMSIRTLASQVQTNEFSPLG